MSGLFRLEPHKRPSGERSEPVVVISCEEAEALFEQVATGKSTDEEVAQLRGHLANCTKCGEAMTERRLQIMVEVE